MAPPSTRRSSPAVVRLLLVLVAAIVLFGLVTYYNRTKTGANERFSTAASQPSPTKFQPLLRDGGSKNALPTANSADDVASNAASFKPSEPASNEKYRPAGRDGAAKSKDPFPQDRVTPEELLPRDAANSKWAQVNPAGQGDVKDQNFLTAGYHIGVDTQGQSLRNASHDIRSEPANPRYKVGIWQLSTIEPDMARRPLE
jgi:hypothetical protein